MNKIIFLLTAAIVAAALLKSAQTVGVIRNVPTVSVCHCA